MRKRSCAFHADTQEEYIKIAIENQYQENFFYDLPDTKPQKPKGRSHKERLAEDLEDDFFFESRTALEKSHDYMENREKVEWSDIHGVSEVREQSRVLFNSPSTCTVDLFNDSAAIYETVEEQPLSVPVHYKYDYMLIGALNVGKHALINSQFPDSSDADSTPLMTRLDLVIRKVNQPNTEITYGFWIKELFNDSYERLIELYYKKCAAFIFVYDLTSRESFEKLEEEITKIKSYVGDDQFVGLLIATQSDKVTQRAVPYEEGVSLKNKYGLKYFNETNMYVEKETQQLLKKLESLVSEKTGAL